MTRAMAWFHIVVILLSVGYSTYALFKGDFEQAFLPYPILILYYLIFARSFGKTSSSDQSYDPPSEH
jgi:hypothetical protein